MLVVCRRLLQVAAVTVDDMSLVMAAMIGREVAVFARKQLPRVSGSEFMITKFFGFDLG